MRTSEFIPGEEKDCDVNEQDGYERWYREHGDVLRRQYPDKHIAVYNNQVVACGDTEEELNQRLSEEGFDEKILYCVQVGNEDQFVDRAEEGVRVLGED